jgi:hypothetical protein
MNTKLNSNVISCRREDFVMGGKAILRGGVTYVEISDPAQKKIVERIYGLIIRLLNEHQVEIYQENFARVLLEKMSEVPEQKEAAETILGIMRNDLSEFDKTPAELDHLQAKLRVNTKRASIPPSMANSVNETLVPRTSSKARPVVKSKPYRILPGLRKTAGTASDSEETSVTAPAEAEGKVAEGDAPAETQQAASDETAGTASKEDASAETEGKVAEGDTSEQPVADSEGQSKAKKPRRDWKKYYRDLYGDSNSKTADGQQAADQEAQAERQVAVNQEAEKIEAEAAEGDVAEKTTAEIATAEETRAVQEDHQAAGRLLKEAEALEGLERFAALEADLIARGLVRK